MAAPYCEEKLAAFLCSIQAGYRSSIQYHNSIHGADVAQMVFILMTQGRLIEIAELSHLDQVALVTAALCHDFDHDGLNNAYHVNANTPRSIRYNDTAV